MRGGADAGAEHRQRRATRFLLGGLRAARAARRLDRSPSGRVKSFGWWPVLCALCVVAGCSGPPTVRVPDDLPPISASWFTIGSQVPAEADAAVVVAFDQVVQADLGTLFGVIDLLTHASTALTDALGIEVAGPDSFSELGLRAGGAMAVFLYRGAWIVVADWADGGRLRELIERFRERNPDLRTRWRDLDGHDVLTVELTGPELTGARLDLMPTDTQLVALLRPGTTAPDEEDDEVLLDSARGAWRENLYFDDETERALDSFGGDAAALFIADVEPFLVGLSALRGDRNHPGVFGAAPEPPRCERVQSAVGVAMPYAIGAISRRLERSGTAPNQALVSERQELRVFVHPRYQSLARGLLRPATLDVEVFESDAVMSGFISIDPGQLVALFGDLADVAACPNLAAGPGLLGRAAQLFRDYPDLVEHFNGFLGGVLFDVRDTGGVAYPDIFLIIGSEEPLDLSQVLQEGLESQMGFHGTPGTVAGLNTVHYRLLLYRIALYEGLQGVGVSIGRAAEPWIEAVLARQPPSTGAFFGFTLDGERALEAIEVLNQIALDPELEGAEPRMLRNGIAALRKLRQLRVRGSFDDGFVALEIVKESTADLSGSARD